MTPGPHAAPAEVVSVPFASAWTRPVKRLFAWIAAAAMAYAVWRSHAFLASAWAQASIGGLLAAMLAWTATHFVSPGFTLLVLGRDHPISYRTALSVHALRLPAKYLPGGIWHMVGRVVDFRSLGHRQPALIDFVLLENLVAAGFALGTGATLLWAVDAVPRWSTSLAGFAILAWLSLALVPWGLRLVTRSGRDFPPWRYLKLLLLACGFWLLAATAFVLFVRAFGGAMLQASLPALYGTYLFSWGAGFVAFFAPQGIGVFEFVSGKLLDGQLELAQAVALMASFRVIALAGDLLAWAVAFAFFRRPSVH